MEMPGSIDALVRDIQPDSEQEAEDPASRPALTRKLLAALEGPNLRGDQAARIVEVIAKINPIPDGTALRLEDMNNEELLRLASDEIAALLRLYGHEPDVKTESLEEAKVMQETLKDKRHRKLDRLKAREIRQRWVSEPVTRKALSEEYGVSVATIKNVLRNQIYKDPLWKKPTHQQRRAAVTGNVRTKYYGKTTTTESQASSATSTVASET